MGKSIDDILGDVGEMGRFQISRLAMLCVIVASPAFQVLIMFFVGHEAPWQCAVNSTTCLLNGTFVAGDNNYNLRCKLDRSDWEYAEYDGPKTSIVTEFDLVCDDVFYGWLATSMIFIGITFTTVPLGIISDRYGRRTILFPSCITMVVIGFASSFVTHYWQFLISRFIIGAAMAGCLLPIILFSAEYVGPRYRPFTEAIVWFSWAIALVILDGIAYYVREWRTLMIVSTAPWIVVLTFWKFIPESMRWSATHNKVDKAEQTLRKIAKINKKEYPEESLSVPSASAKSFEFLALFSTSSLLISLVIQGFAWFVNAMVYFGASFGAGDLGGSIYLNFVLTSLIEVPANLLAIHNSKRFGRKKTVIIYMILGGVACFIVSWIPAGTGKSNYIVGRVIGGILGKGFISVSFCAVYIWSSELFPTVLRASAIAILQTLTNLGSVAAPFVVEANRIHSVLPFGIMGGLAIISALTCLVLPETKNRPTAEVLELVPQQGDTTVLFEGPGNDIQDHPDAEEMKT